MRGNTSQRRSARSSGSWLIKFSLLNLRPFFKRPVPAFAIERHPLDTLIAPTPERLAKASGHELPLINREVERRFTHVLSTVEAMERRGAIRTEQLEAYYKFCDDLERATSTRRVIPLYGRVPSAPTEDPIDLKADAVRSSSGALKAMLEDERSVLVYLVEHQNATLEAVGKHVLLYGSRSKAILNAQRKVQTGLHRLAIHYGFLSSGPV
jgi:hypothetical protein